PIMHTDVWSSSDGINWTLATANVPWLGRKDHTFVTYRGKLWIAAGLGDHGLSFSDCDVWSSVDGVNWQRESPDSSLPARAGHSSAVFENRLWVFGGASNVAR